MVFISAMHYNVKFPWILTICLQFSIKTLYCVIFIGIQGQLVLSIMNHSWKSYCCNFCKATNKRAATFLSQDFDFGGEHWTVFGACSDLQMRLLSGEMSPPFARCRAARSPPEKLSSDKMAMECCCRSWSGFYVYNIFFILSGEKLN